MGKPKKCHPLPTQDELDDLMAEIAAMLNDGGTHTKEYWKAYIKRDRKRRLARKKDASDG